MDEEETRAGLGRILRESVDRVEGRVDSRAEAEQRAAEFAPRPDDHL